MPSSCVVRESQVGSEPRRIGAPCPLCVDSVLPFFLFASIPGRVLPVLDGTFQVLSFCGCRVSSEPLGQTQQTHKLWHMLSGSGLLRGLFLSPPLPGIFCNFWDFGFLSGIHFLWASQGLCDCLDLHPPPTAQATTLATV